MRGVGDSLIKVGTDVQAGLGNRFFRGQFLPRH